MSGTEMTRGRELQSKRRAKLQRKSLEHTKDTVVLLLNSLGFNGDMISTDRLK